MGSEVFRSPLCWECSLEEFRRRQPALQCSPAPDSNQKKIFGLWSSVLVAGVLAAALGKAFISSSESLVAIFCEALAGGAVLALVAHAMIPEALHEGGSLIVLPTVAGFLFALYLSLAPAFV